MVVFAGRLLPVLILACVPVMTAEAQDAVAMVTDVSGKVSFRDGHSVGITAQISSQQILTLENGSRIVLVHMKTGEEFVFGGPCKIHLNAEGRPEGAQPMSVRKAAALQGSIRLKPAGLAQASLVLREVDTNAPTGTSEFAPRGPVLLEPLPEFHWKAAGTGATYRLQISDRGGELLLDLTLDEPGLKLPEHLALTEGGSYTWVLRTTIKGETQTESGKFKLLPKAQREQLQLALPKAGASFSERLVYAAFLDQFELRDEARKHWKALAKERSEDEALKALSER